MKYAFNLLRELVAFDTNANTKKEYVRCAKRLAKEGRALGLQVKVFETKDEQGRRCPSVLLTKDVGAKTTVLFSSHYDVVPPGDLHAWKTPPFKAVRKGGRIYGRGTSDDKAGIVIVLSALHELKQKGQHGRLKKNVKILLNCDEEIGSKYGLEFVAKKHRKALAADYAIILDLSLDYVSVASSGIIMGHLDLHGKQGHAGFPHVTPNIIHRTLPFLQDLLKLKKAREKVRSRFPAGPGSPHKKVWGRFSITILQGGDKTNVIPGHLRIGFDARFLPEENMKRIKAWLRKAITALMKKHKLKGKLRLEGHEGHISKAKRAVLKEIQHAASKAYKRKVPLAGELGGSDALFIENIGIPTVGFGPIGEKTNYHGTNEYIEIRDLQRMKEFVKQLLTT